MGSGYKCLLKQPTLPSLRNKKFIKKLTILNTHYKTYFKVKKERLFILGSRIKANGKLKLINWIKKKKIKQ